MAGYASSFLWESISETKVTSGNEPENIAHFTSIDGLQGILGKGEFFASHFAFMNDPEDCVLLRDRMIVNIIELIKLDNIDLYRKLNSLNERKDIIMLDELSVNKDNLFNYILSCLFIALVNSRYYMNNVFQFSVGSYILSFASGDDFDHLSNWRSYGGDGRGVALVFSGQDLISSIGELCLEAEKKYFKEKNEEDSVNWKVIQPIFVQCRYLSNDEIDIFCKNLMDKLKYDIDSKYINPDEDFYSYLDEICSALIKLGSRVKSSHYRTENEYRLILEDNGLGCAKNLDYRRSGNIILPYVKLNWELRALKKIIRGPKTNTRLKISVDHILREEFQRKYGSIHLIDNLMSKIPYVDNN